MRSSSGTRVHLHRCQPGLVRFVHSVRSRQISRVSHRSRQTNGFDSLLQLLGLFQLEICSLGPSSASTDIFLASSLTTVPALACKIGIVCLRVSVRLSVVCLALAFLLASSLSCPFPSCLSPAQYPSAQTCQVSCAAKSNHRFSVPASTLAREHARLGETICQGNHFQVITVGCWRVFHHSP